MPSDNDVDLETLSFLTKRVGALNSGWAHMMEELDPEALSMPLLIAINNVGTSIIATMSALVEESRKHGYDGPGIEEP